LNQPNAAVLGKAQVYKIVICAKTRPRVLTRSFFGSLKRPEMNDLYTWVSQQHHGLRTFKTFQQKIESLSRDEPEQRGLYRLLSNLVGGYVEAFDEEPLPVEVADRVHRRLLELLGSLDLRANSDRRLADINRVASFDLLHSLGPSPTSARG
jgi:hypothetical protein